MTQAQAWARPLLRQLSVAPDPLTLYAAISDHGRRPNTALLESADLTTRKGTRSVVMAQAAVRATAHGRTVRLRALSPNGHHALAALAPVLATRGTVSWLGAELEVTYPPPETGITDTARLTAPGPLDAVEALATCWAMELTPAPLSVATIGLLSYDLIGAYEALPQHAANAMEVPDFVFWLPESVAVIDHVRRSTRVLSIIFGASEEAPEAARDASVRLTELTAACEASRAPFLTPNQDDTPPVRVDIDDATYMETVRTLKAHIVAGDVFQIVPSRTFQAPCPDPLRTYGHLRALNPSPYMYFLRDAEFTLLGASPETCVKVSGAPKQIEICPIAGTRRRGMHADGRLDADLDARFEAELRLDTKEVAEHMMLVDLARNDVARVSTPGTRHVPRLLGVDRYSHVMHLVSRVEGTLRPELNATQAYAACMNMGTLVGAPKLEAARLLRIHEPGRRGAYGGAVGYLDHDGEMDTAIVIRSAVVRDGVAHIRAGAGVVADSDPQSEADETRKKAQAVLTAVARAWEAHP